MKWKPFQSLSFFGVDEKVCALCGFFRAWFSVSSIPSPRLNCFEEEHFFKGPRTRYCRFIAKIAFVAIWKFEPALKEPIENISNHNNPQKMSVIFLRHVPIEIWFLKQTIKVLNQNSEDSNFMNTFILNEQNYLPIGECTQINKFGGASHR